MKQPKLDPISNQIITSNNNSRDMPKFLLTSHVRFFDFEAAAKKLMNNKKFLTIKKNDSSIQITDQISKQSIKTQVESIKNVSTLQSLLTSDIKIQEKTQKKIYYNKIFSEKKQFFVEPTYIQDHRYKTPEAYQKMYKNKSKFQKPSEFAKIMSQSRKNKSILRHVNQPVDASLSTQQRNKLPMNSLEIRNSSPPISRITLSRPTRFKSVQKERRHTQDSQQRCRSFQKTIEKHKITYDYLLGINSLNERKNGIIKIKLKNLIRKCNQPSGWWSKDSLDLIKKSKEVYKQMKLKTSTIRKLYSTIYFILNFQVLRHIHQ